MRVLVTLLFSSTFAIAASPKAHRVIDPDDAYKNNCLRCHTALPEYSPQMNKTIMMHMKQAANIPGDEAQAILRYLNGAPLEPAKSIPASTKSQQK